MDSKQETQCRHSNLTDRPVFKIFETQLLLSESRTKYLKNIGLHLTQHEKQCLYLSAQGKKLKEIASFLNVSQREINQYRQSILQKLGCKTMSSAIIVGIHYGEVKATDLLAEG